MLYIFDYKCYKCDTFSEHWIILISPLHNEWVKQCHEIRVNQEFALGFGLLYFHDKDWPCSGSNHNAQTSKFFCRLPKPIRTWSPRRFPFGHVSGHVATWHVARNVSKWKSPWTPSTYICQDVRDKVSRPSGQRWPRADACNVAIIKAAKSELNWLTMLGMIKSILW